MSELSHVGDDIVQGFNYFLMLDAVFNDDEDGVITCNGTNDFGNIAAVNIPSNRTGIARACLYDAHVTRKIDADKPWHLHHFFDVAWRGYTFVHRVVGQNIDITAAHRGSLGHL